MTKTVLELLREASAQEYYRPSLLLDAAAEIERLSPIANTAIAYVKAWTTHPEDMLDEWSALFKAVEGFPSEPEKLG